MSTPADTLHGLVLEHLQLVGVAEDVVAPLRASLESAAGKKKGEGSTLYQLFSTVLPALAAPAPGAPKAGSKAASVPPAAMAQAQQQAVRMSQGSMAPPPAAPAMQAAPLPGGSVTLTPQQAAYAQQQFQANPDTRPLVAKEPKVRDAALDGQLMSAASSNAHDKIPGLVSGGAYVNMQDPNGTSPLLAATEAGHLEAVKALLVVGADVNLSRKDGTTPLISAYKTNKKKILKELTAAAFSTLSRAVHSTAGAGMGTSVFSTGALPEEEGVSHIDILQMRDETQKLLGMKTAKPAEAAPPPPKPKVADEDQGVGEIREGAVRLLLQDLTNAGAR